MQNPAQETGMSSIEIESVAVSELGTLSCANELLKSSGKCVQELDVSVEKHAKAETSKKSICFDVVLSGNGFDYLGP